MHKINVVSLLEFQSYSEFLTFKGNLKGAQYIQPRPKELLKNGDEVMYFVCRRSCETQHYNVHREERLIRVHPSVKLSANCLSRFRVCIHNDGTASVIFHHHHTGHDPDTDHLNTMRLRGCFK